MKFFHFFQHFFHIKSLEQDFRLICHMSVSQLIQDLFTRRRHKGFQKSCTGGDSLDQIPEDSLQTVFLRLVLSQSPRHRLINILIAAFEQIKDFCNGIRHPQAVHLFIYCFWSILHNRLQICIHFFCRTFVGNCSSKIFICHGNSTVYKVAQCISQIRIQPLYHQFPGNDSVVFKRHLMKYKIAHCIHSEEIDQLVSVEYISL